MSESVPPHILFLCTGNACRSQMAEGLLKRLAGDRYRISSAGVMPAGFVHELAIEAVHRVGGDLGGQHSKHVSDLFVKEDEAPDLIVCLCKHARKKLRKLRLPPVPVLEWHLPDPINARGNKDERMTAFRWACDHICIRLEDAIDGDQFEKAIAEGKQSKSLPGRIGRLLGSLFPQSS
ncbi:MAG: arsenate reductase ArsC [Planctomycetota bacterium]